MQIDDAIHGISTLIVVQTQHGSSQGSGFFYHALAPKDPSKQEQWVQIEDTWLVTNRHVVLPKIAGNEVIPDTLTFHLRKASATGVIWEPIQITQIGLTQDFEAPAEHHGFVL